MGEKEEEDEFWMDTVPSIIYVTAEEFDAIDALLYAEPKENDGLRKLAERPEIFTKE